MIETSKTTKVETKYGRLKPKQPKFDMNLTFEISKLKRMVTGVRGKNRLLRIQNMVKASKMI